MSQELATTPVVEQHAKTSISPRSSPPGTFREEERLRLSSRNSILMMQTNVYIINPVVMGFQIQICPILRAFWSILVKCCVHLPTSSSKTLDYFVTDSSRLHLTFVAFCLLSVIRKQQLKQCNYSVDQSALLTRFRTDFTSSVWNFCL